MKGHKSKYFHVIFRLSCGVVIEIIHVRFLIQTFLNLSFSILYYTCLFCIMIANNSKIIFTFTLTCFVISFLISIACSTIAFAFTITRNMFCHGFSFIFVNYHIKCLNIYVFCFFWNTYFWGKDITIFNVFIETNH